MTKQKQTIPVGTKLSEQDYNELKAIADADFRTISSLVKKLILELLSKREEVA